MKSIPTKGRFILSRPWVLVCVLTAVFAVYVPSLQNGFVNWDDDAHVYENASVRGLDRDHLQQIFTERVNKTYIPLTTLSFAVEHHFFKLDPFYYHLNNLLLHLGVVMLVFVLAGRIGLSDGAAGLAALVFGLHPMHVESVAWITERKDVLYSLFYLLALLSYLTYLRTRSVFQLALTAVWGTLSLLAKPMALSLPLILLLMDWFTERKIDRRAVLEKVPFFAIAVGIAWITYIANARVPGQDPVASALTWCWTLAFYIRQFVFPLDSVPINRLPYPIVPTNPEYLLSLLVIAALVWTLVKFRRNRWFIFAFLYFFLSIFFLLRFDDSVDVTVVADRFMYLPSLGICLALGIWFERIAGDSSAQKAILKNFGRLCICLLLILMGWKSYAQTFFWKDSPTLWHHQLSIVPWDPIAHNNLATILRDRPDIKGAEVRFQTAKESGGMIGPETMQRIQYIEGLYLRAIRNNPKYADAYYNLGNFYYDLGWKDRSVPLYAKAIDLDKEYKNAYINLRNTYSDLGRDDKAIALAYAAVALDPSDNEIYQNIILAFSKILQERPDTAYIYGQERAKFLKAYHSLLENQPAKAGDYFALGYLYTEMGHTGRAVDFYKKAVQLNPQYTDAWYNLANIIEESGNPKEAVELYEKVIRLDSGFSQAYLNLGVLKGRMGERDQAKGLFAKAIEADPYSANAYFNLGFIEESSGNLAEAAKFYRQTISVNPRHAEGYYNLGNVLAGQGKLAEAVESYAKTVSINQSHIDGYVNMLGLSLQLNDIPRAAWALEQAQKLGYEAPAEYIEALNK